MFSVCRWLFPAIASHSMPNSASPQEQLDTESSVSAGASAVSSEASAAPAAASWKEDPFKDSSSCKAQAAMPHHRGHKSWHCVLQGQGRERVVRA